VKRIFIAALAATIAPAALAQSSGEPAVIVTASRFPERRLDAPVGMIVVSAEQIANDNARTLPEILSHLGGVYVRDNSGSPDKQIDLRGFGITGDQNTLVLLDGIRLNENDLSATRLSAIALQSIERIEILPGSGAVLYGGGATGGTINIITKGPRPSRKDADVFAGAGSYGTADTRASANLAGERFGALFSGSHYESDNYRFNNAVRQDIATGDLRFTGDAGSLAMKFGSDWQRLQLPGAVPESQLASNPRAATTPGNWTTRDGDFITLLGRRQLNDIELAADLGYRDQLVKSNIVDFASSFTQFGETRLHSLVFSPRLLWNAAPFGLRSSLVFGADWSDWDYDRNSADNFGDLATAQATQSSAAFYFQNNTVLTDAVKVTLGWREQRVDDRLVQTGFPVSDERQIHTPSAGEIGLQYAIRPQWTLFGKAGTSFRVATVDDNALTASGHLLEPQTARQREAGTEYREDGVRVRVSAYDMYLENEIYFSPIVVPFGANTNLSPTHRTGAQLFASFRVSSELELSGEAKYQTAKFRYGTYGGVHWRTCAQPGCSPRRPS
jgi:iron complex outermembrane receptor protein